MIKWHINDKGEVGRCSATKGNCPFGGASGLENHYSSREEAVKTVASSMDGFSNLGTASKKQSNDLFKRNTESLRKSLVDFGVKNSTEFPEVRSTEELVQRWFDGNHERLEAFKKLVSNQTMSDVSKQSVADLLFRGVTVEQVESVDSLKSSATVDILDDSLHGISLAQLRASRPF